MATTLSTAKEFDAEELYHTMSEDELQNLLNKETCLDRRLILRKELRTRRNNNALTRAVSQVQTKLERNVEPPIIQSSRNKVFNVQLSRERNDDIKTNKTVIEERKLPSQPYSLEIQKELDQCITELRNTLDVNRRRYLRTKIKELQAHVSITNVSTHSDTQSKYIDEVDKSKESAKLQDFQHDRNFTNKQQEDVNKEVPITNGPQGSFGVRHKESNNLLRTSSNKIIKESSLSQRNQTESDHVITTKDQKIKESSKQFVSSKPESNITKLSFKEIKPQSSVNTSFKVDYKKEIISEEAKEVRPKLKKQVIQKTKFQEMDDVILQYESSGVDIENDGISWFYNNQSIETYPKSYFSNLICSKHCGNNVMLHFSDSSVKNHQGIYRLVINSKSEILEVLFEVVIESKAIVKEGSYNKSDIVNINEIKGTSSDSIFQRTLAPLDKDFTVILMQPEVKSSLESTPKEIKKTNVSRVSSMREMFEKKPEANKFELNSNKEIKRKVVVHTPLGKELEDLVKEQNITPVENKFISSLKASEDSQGGLRLPSQPSRKISQTGLMKMIPMMKSKAKMARSTVQQMKELFLNFCKYNTEEYENINVTNYSGSWADGLAFCALIHHFYPDSFDYSKLSSSDRLYNFNLAFETAKERAGIDSLLDAEDMIISDSPDWKCVYTYVQLIYSKLKTHPRNVMRKVEDSHF